METIPELVEIYLSLIMYSIKVLIQFHEQDALYAMIYLSFYVSRIFCTQLSKFFVNPITHSVMQLTHHFSKPCTNFARTHLFQNRRSWREHKISSLLGDVLLLCISLSLQSCWDQSSTKPRTYSKYDCIHLIPSGNTFDKIWRLESILRTEKKRASPNRSTKCVYT